MHVVFNLLHVEPPFRLPSQDAPDELHAGLGQVVREIELPLQDGMLQSRDGAAFERHRTRNLEDGQKFFKYLPLHRSSLDLDKAG